LDKVTQEAAAQFILQPQYTDNIQNIREGVITKELPCSQCKLVIPYRC